MWLRVSLMQHLHGCVTLLDDYMTTYNLLELITVYVKKLLEKDKKKPQLDSPFYNNNNTKKMSIKISICIKKCVFCWNKVMINCVNILIWF